MQRQFVMHMRPSHAATIKGESIKEPTAVTEAAQSNSADRTQVPKKTAPKAQAK